MMEIRARPWSGLIFVLRIKESDYNGAVFDADVYDCIADFAGIYRVAAEAAEEGSRCEWQRDHASVAGTVDRVS